MKQKNCKKLILNPVNKYQARMKTILKINNMFHFFSPFSSITSMQPESTFINTSATCPVQALF